MSRDRMLAGAGKATQKMGKPAWTLMSVKWMCTSVTAMPTVQTQQAHITALARPVTMVMALGVKMWTSVHLMCTSVTAMPTAQTQRAHTTALAWLVTMVMATPVLMWMSVQQGHMTATGMPSASILGDRITVSAWTGTLAMEENAMVLLSFVWSLNILNAPTHPHPHHHPTPTWCSTSLQGLWPVLKGPSQPLLCFSLHLGMSLTKLLKI